MPGQLLFLVLCFFAAVLGVTHSPFFFSIHLLDIVNKSSDLQSVFKALALNSRSIIMTAVLGLVCTCMHADVDVDEDVLDEEDDETGDGLP